MRNLLLSFMIFAAALASAQEPYSVRMIRSEMKRNPDATYLDGRNGERKWNYTTGLELKSFMDAARRYEMPEVVDYVRAWADTMATEKGEVYKYKKSNYNVDHICPARIYFDLHDMYGDQDKRYRRVLRMIREQIDSQP
ncbi:MAG: glycoside hydrolase family 88 protein, partial [Bacteroidales bacterium]|nr:glycoside hydrolase family 88 protein [Bacteroidales bacterium]